MSSTPVTSTPTKNPALPALIILLGLGALAFGILTVIFYAQATSAKKTAATATAAAVTKAKADQKQADQQASAIAAGLPFRSYTAPSQFGSFEIKYPKDWSAYVVQQSTGTQISLTLNPNLVRRVNGSDDLVAARVVLTERTSDQYLSSYSTAVTRGTLKQANITVSGQKAIDLTGAFGDKKTLRQVVVPVRDKVIVFSTEDKTYASQFNQILAQAKIIP